MHVEAAIRKDFEQSGSRAVLRPIEFPPANSNRPRKRKRLTTLPMPPQATRTLEQKLMVADEFWHQMLTMFEANGGAGSGAALAMFSCFVHSIIEDRELCKKLILYFDQKLNDDFLSREAVSST